MIILGNPLVILGEHVASKRCLLLEPSRTWIQKDPEGQLHNSLKLYEPCLQTLPSIFVGAFTYLKYLLGITRIEASLYSVFVATTN